MTPTTFLRLLPIPIDAKGDVLAERIAALNAAGRAEDVFTLDPAAFAQIPGSPFAYWVSDVLRLKFTEPVTLGTYGFSVQHGLSTKNDFRWLRLSWEVPITERGVRWFPLAKGGAFARYYSDLHLLVDARDDFKALEQELLEKYPYLGDNAGWVLHPESSYLVSGLTYTRRTTRQFSVRALPSDSYFSDKGPACIGNQEHLATLLAVLNSTLFQYYVELQMGAATAAARSYEVGVIQRTPIPPLTDDGSRAALAALAREAHDLQRDRDRMDETTHAFGLPSLVQQRAAPSLAVANQSLDAAEQSRLARLAAIQTEIDEIVLGLYGLTSDDLRLPAPGETGSPLGEAAEAIEDQEDEEEEPTVVDTLPRRVADLLQWCVGAAFGRWDVRMALDPSLLPVLGGPFDLLPRCAPGALVGVDGLPAATVDAIAPEAWLRACQTVPDLPAIDNSQLTIANCQLPLPFPEDGILVDDPTHPSDIVTRVRQVLRLLWGERADAVEQEACQALGVRDLRSWFRDPRQGFFTYHIKRYSKSRRKAPIYWLLQSEKRNYAIWLYCHRLHKHSLYVAGRDYADAKVRLEETRLAELREGLDGLAGSARRQREREIDRQEKLVAEITAFRNTLDQIALRNLPPDLNDGVLLSVAPLHPLLPWKEVERMWDALVKGEYGWSTMSQQMKEKGLAMVN